MPGACADAMRGTKTAATTAKRCKRCMTRAS
jgi:hypothetical protein